ncbi:MAG: ribose-5-phosphate isomerase RpiA [Tepidisphaeraceae bacterium]
MNPKQRAAEASLQFVRDGMVVGLGTGSTADYFLQALAAALRAGRLKNVRGIPTSRQSERRAEHLGIPLITLADAKPDVTIDGADEVAPNLDLIKGLGGALLREKIVAQNSGQLIIIADAGKAVEKLGTKSPLPVEVAPFSHEVHAAFFRSLGATPTLRRTSDGAVYVTDNGNYIYDCKFTTIENAAALDVTLHGRAGVVETGLFVGIASVALIAAENGVEERRARIVAHDASKDRVSGKKRG